MASVTDWGKRGTTGFTRDPANEQAVPLAAGATFTGQWTRVDQVVMFAVLYGTHVPFTMRIEWSKDGVTQDTDPFATTSPQVRNRLGLYSVISFQSTFFRPWYRIKVINGPAAQLFAISDALLMKSIFPGYLIDVDGPIPVLGLAALNHGLGWGRTPTDWQPLQLTALKNQKIALAENLLGPLPVALDADTLMALEQITVTNPTDVSGLATQATLAALGPKLDAILAAVDGLEGLLATPAWLSWFSTSTTVTQVKTGPGVVHGVRGPGTVTLYDATAGTTGQFFGIDLSVVKTVDLDIAFTNGLRVKGGGGTGTTVVYR